LPFFSAESGQAGSLSSSSRHWFGAAPGCRFFLLNPDRLEACPHLQDIGSELLLVAVFFLLNPDRLPACPHLQDIGSELLLVAVFFY
jgi:hypothetical protein